MARFTEVGLVDDSVDVQIGGVDYLWETLEVNDPRDRAWAHPGVAVSPGDAVYVGDASGSRVVSISPSGIRTATSLPVTECHGLAVTAGGGIWVADNGHKLVPEGAGYVDVVNAGQVILVDPTRGLIQRLNPPTPWSPCGVALHDFGHGSDGRIWVADGYGKSLVHCFSSDGELLWTSDGRDSGIAFRQPHGIAVDTRSSPPLLLIADRGNRRIVALSLDGCYLRTIGQGIVTSPSGFAVDGNRLWVTELHGSLVMFDADDREIGRIGTDIRWQSPDWPNIRRNGAITRPKTAPGRFRSPHGIAVTSKGTVVITEWHAGGRVTQLVPVRTNDRQAARTLAEG